MTESEWLACTDPQSMMEFLRGKASVRKSRLYVSAHWRQVWGRSAYPDALLLVETAERFIDRLTSRRRVRKALAVAVARTSGHDDVLIEGGWAIGECRSEAYRLATFFITNGELDRYWRETNYPRLSSPQETALLRCVFGNPFRPMCLDACWLAWNDGAVRKMTQVIYDERRFSDLPLLADALEEAGCTVAAILDHCRSGGEHVRGCWVVDLLLGKE